MQGANWHLTCLTGIQATSDVMSAMPVKGISIANTTGMPKHGYTPMAGHGQPPCLLDSSQVALWRHRHIPGTGVGPGCNIIEYLKGINIKQKSIFQLKLKHWLPNSAIFDGDAGNLWLQRSRAELLLRVANWDSTCQGFAWLVKANWKDSVAVMDMFGMTWQPPGQVQICTTVSIPAGSGQVSFFI